MEIIERRAVGSSQYLIGGVLVSLSASICCIGPFVLLATGISGAWMSRLMILQPYQPIFVLLTLALLGRAGWKIFRPVIRADVGDSCSVLRIGRRQKAAFVFTCTLATLLLTSEYWISMLAQV